MRIGLKILLALVLVLLVFHLGLNIMGIRLNTDWFSWVMSSCPQSYKDWDLEFNTNTCKEYKASHSTPLFLHKVF